MLDDQYCTSQKEEEEEEEVDFARL